MKRNKPANKGLLWKILLFQLYFLVITLDVVWRKLHLITVSFLPLRILFHHQLYLSLQEYLVPSMIDTWLRTLPALGIGLLLKFMNQKTERAVRMFLDTRKEIFEKLNTVHLGTAGIDFYQECARAVTVYQKLEKQKHFMLIPFRKFRLFDDAAEAYQNVHHPQHEAPPAPEPEQDEPASPGYDFSPLIFLERLYPNNPLSAYAYGKNCTLSPEQEKEIQQFLKKIIVDFNTLLLYIKQNAATVLRPFTKGYPLFEEKQRELRMLIDSTKPIRAKTDLNLNIRLISGYYQNLASLDMHLTDAVLERYQIRISYYHISLLKISPSETQETLSELCAELESELEALDQIHPRFGSEISILSPLLLKQPTQQHPLRQINSQCRKADELLKSIEKEGEFI